MLSNFFQKVKNFAVEYQDRIVLISGIVLIASISFGLGKLYNIRSAKEPIFIEEPVELNFNNSPVPEQANKQTVDARLPAPERGDGGQSDSGLAAILVASRKGKYYHLPSCSGAKRIKPENKIEFSSAKEAEAAGYKPAGNCPGLTQ